MYKYIYIYVCLRMSNQTTYTTTTTKEKILKFEGKKRTLFFFVFAKDILHSCENQEKKRIK